MTCFECKAQEIQIQKPERILMQLHETSGLWVEKYLPEIWYCPRCGVLDQGTIRTVPTGKRKSRAKAAKYGFDTTILNEISEKVFKPTDQEKKFMEQRNELEVSNSFTEKE
jgi:hypothetical protein